MKTQRKRMLWLVMILILGGLLFQAWRYAPLIYPQHYFTYRYDYENLEIHANLPLGLLDLDYLPGVHMVISEHPYFDEDATYRIFLCDTTDQYSRFVSLLNLPTNSQGQTIQPPGNVFVSLQAINRTKTTFGARYPSTLLEGSTSHILLHELTHALVYRYLGYWRSRSLPFWISEGYAEYIAGHARRTAHSEIALVKRLRRFERVKSRIPPIRRAYLQAGLLVEFLLDIEGIDRERLLGTPISKEEVLARLDQWVNTQTTDNVQPEA